jgi:hypothetical protein
VDDTSEKHAALDGDAGKVFIPESIGVKVSSKTGSPNGDAKIQVGTATGLGDILAETELTGLDEVNEVYWIPLPKGLSKALAGNADVYVKCTVEDSGATTLVGDVVVKGSQY